MLFAFMKVRKTSLVNRLSLSLCKCSGRPYLANTSRNSPTVLSADAETAGSTSGHLLCAMKNIQRNLHEYAAMVWQVIPTGEVAR